MPKVIEWRRHFHQNPELSNREYKTGAFVADYLKSLGLEVRYPIAKTGVVAILKGGKPGPVIALRADMDALPVTELPNVPFYSKVIDTFNNQTTGVMHACGHDSHTAILMGAATVLTKMRSEVQGTVVFLFQPSEEGAPNGEEGGARLMIKDGALANPKPEAVFGLHIRSNMEVGTLRYKQGPFMAAADFFTINVTGKGSHGALPWNGIDPITTSSLIIQGLQTIVSRQEDITRSPVIITIGSIKGGIRNNIVPETCVMMGTVRTLDESIRKDVMARMQQTITNIAASAGATATLTITRSGTMVFNDSSLVTATLPALQAAAGKSNVQFVNWSTIGEDFADYQSEAPTFFFYLGGMPKGTDPAKAPDHHTSAFYIDESGFDAGVKAFCQIVMNYSGVKK